MTVALSAMVILLRYPFISDYEQKSLHLPGASTAYHQRLVKSSFYVTALLFNRVKETQEGAMEC